MQQSRPPALRVCVVIPDLDFDPSEVAVPWRALRDRQVEVRFATATGQEACADEMMLTGQGLDLWGAVPGLRRFKLLGLLLRANALARQAYRAMRSDPSFQSPLSYGALKVEDFDGLLLPGGHRARGMQAYLESAVLQRFVGAFFASGKPVGAICHGVVLAARSRSPITNRSVLYGRKTTALPWAMEKSAWNLSRFLGRVWDPHYYRTYLEQGNQREGACSVEAEVTAALAGPHDFVRAPASFSAWLRKSSGLFRDRPGDARAAHVVVDENYVSARWPGDVHTFARAFGDVLEHASQAGSASFGSRYFVAEDTVIRVTEASDSAAEHRGIDLYR